MRVSCSTCLEVIGPSDDLSSSPCGHVFHTGCILQWLETSKSGRGGSCPQCRSDCKEAQLRRLYFTQGSDATLGALNGGSATDQLQALQDRVDSLTFQLRCCETDKKAAADARDKAVAQNVALRDEYRSIEGRLAAAKEEVYATKAQNRSLREEARKAAEARAEAKELQEKLESYRRLELLLSSSAAEVNRAMHQSGDFSKASREQAFVVVMLKQELENKGREVAVYRKESASKSGRIDELKASIDVLMQGNAQLSGKVDSLRAEVGQFRSSAALALTSSDKSGKENSCIAIDTPSPVQLMKPKSIGIMALTRPSASSMSSLASITSGNAFLKKLEADDDDDEATATTSLPAKRSFSLLAEGGDGDRKRRAAPSSSSLLMLSSSSSTRKPSMSQPEMFYDGLGGHSKPDHFPDPSSRAESLSTVNSVKINGCGKPPIKRPKKGLSRPIKPSSQASQGLNRPIDTFFSALKS